MVIYLWSNWLFSFGLVVVVFFTIFGLAVLLLISLLACFCFNCCFPLVQLLLLFLMQLLAHFRYRWFDLTKLPVYFWSSCFSCWIFCGHVVGLLLLACFCTSYWLIFWANSLFSCSNCWFASTVRLPKLIVSFGFALDLSGIYYASNYLSSF